MSTSHDGHYYAEANAAASSIARRLKDLRNYQLPRLKDSRDASLQADVAAEMKDDLELTMRTIDVSRVEYLSVEEARPYDVPVYRTLQSLRSTKTHRQIGKVS